MATNQTLTATLGDTHTIVMPILIDGRPYTNISVADARMLFKRNPSDDDDDAIIDKALADGITVDDNVVTCVVTPADQASLTKTTTLHWSCKVQESAGTESTISFGTLALVLRATRGAL